MILSFKELHKLIDKQIITALPENVNAASIDIRIGDEIMIEEPVGLVDMAQNSDIVDLSDKNNAPKLVKVKIPDSGIAIAPGQFFLATSIETFNLPNTLSCEFKLRSSVARSGLQHMLAGWCDAGWHGSQLTMEFKNVLQHHTLLLKPNMRIGQMVFFPHADAKEGSYSIKGRYNHQKGVQPSKGVAD